MNYEQEKPAKAFNEGLWKNITTGLAGLILGSIMMTNTLMERSNNDQRQIGELKAAVQILTGSVAELKIQIGQQDVVLRQLAQAVERRQK